MDATGKRHEIPMGFAGSYEVCGPDNIRDANLPPFLLHNRYSQMQYDFSSRTTLWKLGFNGDIWKRRCTT